MSMKTYGTVVYLKHGKNISFVISKSRVKPMKDVTLYHVWNFLQHFWPQVSKLVLSVLSHLHIGNVTTRLYYIGYTVTKNNQCLLKIV